MKGRDEYTFFQSPRHIQPVFILGGDWSSYEQRQRLWALGMGDQFQSDGNNIIDVNKTEEVIEETAKHSENGTPCMTCLVTLLGKNTNQFIVMPCLGL